MQTLVSALLANSWVKLSATEQFAHFHSSATQRSDRIITYGASCYIAHAHIEIIIAFLKIGSRSSLRKAFCTRRYWDCNDIDHDSDNKSVRPFTLFSQVLFCHFIVLRCLLGVRRVFSNASRTSFQCRVEHASAVMEKCTANWWRTLYFGFWWIWRQANFPQAASAGIAHGDTDHFGEVEFNSCKVCYRRLHGIICTHECASISWTQTGSLCHTLQLSRFYILHGTVIGTPICCWIQAHKDKLALAATDRWCELKTSYWAWNLENNVISSSTGSHIDTPRPGKADVVNESVLFIIICLAKRCQKSMQYARGRIWGV